MNPAWYLAVTRGDSLVKTYSGVSLLYFRFQTRHTPWINIDRVCISLTQIIPICASPLLHLWLSPYCCSFPTLVLGTWATYKIRL